LRRRAPVTSMRRIFARAARPSLDRIESAAPCSVQVERTARDLGALDDPR
jgi:hypothetical protein